MKIKIYLLTTIIILLISGCQEEIDLGSSKYQQIPVITGKITNASGPYTVTVSFSSKVNEPRFIPYTNCVVTIFENTGLSETLEETEPGVYKTRTGGITGKVGNSYKLEVKTPDGKIYQSDLVKIKEPIAIDTVYKKLEYKQELEMEKDIPGYKFYISSREVNLNNAYFLWELIETYEYTAEHELKGTLYKGILNENTEKDSLYRCWKTQYVNKIFTANTIDLSVPKVINQPLHFVDNQTKRLQHKYSLEVHQYAINQQTYEYWNNIKEQISDNNFLYSRQPFPIRGNIYNPNNKKEPVLGNFTVASVTKKRIFVNNLPVPLNIQKCDIRTDWQWIVELSMIDTLYIVNPPDGDMGMVHETCVNCMMEGGSPEKPIFWEIMESK